MASVSEFFSAPSEGFLHSCTKNQLLLVADHYGIDFGDKKHKGEIKDFVLAALKEQGVTKGELVLGEAPEPLSVIVV